jgi:hypothetical protein
MISVGIHTPVVLEKAPILNEKGTLEIYMKKATGGNVLDLFNSSSDTSSVSDENNTFLEFNPLATERFGNELSPADISKDITAFKDKLSHIALFYKTSDAVKWDILRGTGITEKNMATKVKDQAILDIIYKNICEDFIKNLQGADLGKKFHLKTVRQSKVKHFAKLPESKFGFSGSNAFVQPSELPCTLKYSDYEQGWRTSNGVKAKTGIDLSSGEPLVADSTISEEDSSAHVAEINNVFGA